MYLAPTLSIGSILLALTATPGLVELPRPAQHQDGDHTFLCGLLQIQREFRRAIEHCDAALKVNPADVDTLSNRGGSHLRLGNLDMALADFNSAITARPQDAKNFFNRALVHSAKGQHQQAIADYDKALELLPSLAIAYHNRAHEYERIGDRGKAISDYRKALSVDPGLRRIATQNLRRLGAEP